MKNAQILFIGLLALVLSTAHLHGQGQLLFQENFLTPTSDLATLTGSPWVLIPAGTIGSTTSPPFIVVNPGTALTYPGYFESGNGNSAYLAGAGQDIQAPLSASITTGVVYCSFMIKVDSASAAGDYCIMIRNTSNHNRWRMWLKSTNAGANFEFGLTKGAGTTYLPKYTTNNYSFGVTYLVVLKYDFNTDASTTDAKLSLFVNPSPSSFGKSEDTSATSRVIKEYQETGTSDFVSTAGLNRIALIMQGTGTAPYFSIGGIRIATDWKTTIPPAPMYYDFSGTGDPTDPNNWGTNLDGSGIHPSDFTADNQWYLIRNATPASLQTITVNSIWAMTGIGAKLIIGAGVNLILGPSAYLAGTVDVSSGGILTIQSADNFYWPLFGNISGTVSFENSAGFTLTGNQILKSGGVGYFVLKNGDITVPAGDTLRVKGRFRTGANIIKGSGAFVLDSAGTLSISSTNGITASSASGDIQTTGRSFSRYATYEYFGQSNQLTGAGIPDTVSNLTVLLANRNLTLALAKAIVVTGNLTLSLGKCVLGNFDLTFSNPGGYSDSSYVITNGTGALIRPIANINKKTMPLGSAVEFRQTAITFEATPTGGTRNIAFRFVTGDTGSVGFPPGITYRYEGGYWTITADSANTATYRLDVNVPLGFGFPDTSFRVLQRTSNAVKWNTVGTVGTYAAGVLSQAGIDRFGQFAIGVGASAPPPPPGKRYQGEVFSSYQLQSNIQYGSTGLQVLDIYSGTGDTVKNRPLVIFVPGGGFKGVNAPGGFSDLVCGGLAKRGYLVAFIRYYRTNSSIPNDTVHFETMLKALQDVKAAVRFFRKNGAGYGIDTSQIFMTGSSAGSITALHLAYLDSAEVPKYVNWSNVGGTFEGNDRGNAGYSSRIRAVISNWGAIGDTAWMKTGDVPVYCVHGTADSTVFYDSIPADGPFRFSSKYINAAAKNKGIQTGLRVFYNTGHTLDNNATKQDSAYKDFAAWLYTALKPVVHVAEGTSVVPTSFELYQNYPNPFNPTTKITYALPFQAKVTLVVYNILGQQVATPVDGLKQAGYHTVDFDASHLASGVYFYRASTAAASSVKKMLLLK